MINFHYLLFPPLSASWGQGKPIGWWNHQGGEETGEGRWRDRQEQENQAEEREKGKAEKTRRTAEPLAAVCWHHLWGVPMPSWAWGYWGKERLWSSCTIMDQPSQDFLNNSFMET